MRKFQLQELSIKGKALPSGLARVWLGGEAYTRTECKPVSIGKEQETL